MNRRVFIAGTTAMSVLQSFGRAGAASLQIPMRVQNNHTFASFGIPDARGNIVPVLTQIDTGGGALILSRKKAAALGLKIEATGAPKGLLPLQLNRIFVGSQGISVPRAATTEAEMEMFGPGAASPAFFAASCLREHVVTFNYIDGRFSLDGPAIGGVSLPVEIAPSTGFPRIELTIDGERMGFLLDTGASFTMLSRSVIDKLHGKNPSWNYAEGAYGPANMIGGEGEALAVMMRIPGVQWGPIKLDNVDVVSRAPGTFEQYMSSMMTAPVVGALGGNVLRNFALRLDYPRQKLEARFQRRPWPDELTIVPLNLQAHADGTFTISGGASSQDLVGSRLVAIEGSGVKGLALEQVQQLLRGPVGAKRTLMVEVEGQPDRNVTLTTVNVL